MKKSLRNGMMFSEEEVMMMLRYADKPAPEREPSYQEDQSVQYVEAYLETSDDEGNELNDFSSSERGKYLLAKALIYAIRMLESNEPNTMEQAEINDMRKLQLMFFPHPVIVHLTEWLLDVQYTFLSIENKQSGQEVDKKIEEMLGGPVNKTHWPINVDLFNKIVAENVKAFMELGLIDEEENDE
jgi:hypothetical protein